MKHSLQANLPFFIHTYKKISIYATIVVMDGKISKNCEYYLIYYHWHLSGSDTHYKNASFRA